MSTGGYSQFTRVSLLMPKVGRVEVSPIFEPGRVPWSAVGAKSSVRVKTLVEWPFVTTEGMELLRLEIEGLKFIWSPTVWLN